MKNQEQESNFQLVGGIINRTLLQRQTEFSGLVSINFLRCYSCSYHSSMDKRNTKCQTETNQKPKVSLEKIEAGKLKTKTNKQNKNYICLSKLTKSFAIKVIPSGQKMLNCSRELLDCCTFSMNHWIL